MRRLPPLLLLACLGCTEMDKAMLDLDVQMQQNMVLYGKVSKAFAETADQMATNKHTLQSTLIQRTDAAWIASKTQDGKVVASVEEMKTWMAQRDAAVNLMVSSKETWNRVSADYKDSVDEIVKLSEDVMKRKISAAEAKQRFTDLLNKAVSLIAGAGAASAIGLPLAL